MDPAQVEAALLSVMPRYRWTALDCVKDLDLTGKTAIVTGATSGIGIPTAQAIAKAGARVVVTARDMDKGEKVVAEMKTASGNDNITTMRMDLMSLTSVREFVAEFHALGWGVDMLVNNAGIMACDYSKTTDGFESQLQVNFIAPFVLINALVPDMKDKARVVIVSSVAHKRIPADKDVTQFFNFEPPAYDKWIAYAAAKSYAIMLSNEFNTRMKAAGKSITCTSLHPGGIMTGLQKNLTQDEMKALGWIDDKGEVMAAFKTLEQGASTTVYAAVSPELDGKGGVYLENCAVTEKDDFGGEHPLISRARGTAAHVWDEAACKVMWTKAEEALGTKYEY